MKFIIMDRVKAENFNTRQRYAVIGMVGQYDEHPTLREGYADRLKLKFNDTEKILDDFPGMTPDDAKKILEFVEKNKDNVDLFVVHCNAGISRSSGTAAALSKIYNDDDSWVFGNKKYCPNMFVYRTILSMANEMGLHL